MNTIVLNLGNLAVTEYTATCTGVSEDFEVSSTGLYKVGGTKDGDAVFTPAWTFGLELEPAAKRRQPKYIYLHGKGNKGVKARVRGGQTDIDFSYDFQPGHGLAGRFVLGSGIKDSALKLSFTRLVEGAFEVTRIELVDYDSTNRRL